MEHVSLGDPDIGGVKFLGVLKSCDVTSSLAHSPQPAFTTSQQSRPDHSTIAQGYFASRGLSTTAEFLVIIG